MIQYQKILFPIKLSDSTVQLIPHVESLAKHYNSEVHFVYVAKASEYYVEDEPIAGKSIQEKFQAFVEKHCQAFVETKTVLLQGEVASEILSYAQRVKPDMIIMAIKGRSALGKAVFGSVAGEVVRDAEIPVLLARSMSKRQTKK